MRSSSSDSSAMYQLNKKDLADLIKQKNLQDRITVLATSANLRSFIQNFTSDSTQNYSCILYLQSETSKLTHKSCIVFIKRDDGKIDAILSDSTSAESGRLAPEVQVIG